MRPCMPETRLCSQGVGALHCARMRTIRYRLVALRMCVFADLLKAGHGGVTKSSPRSLMRAASALVRLSI